MNDIFGKPVNLKTTLKRRFIMPPFSILNAREGDWQNRKRQWLQLGIKSEVGRTAKAFNIGNQATKENGWKVEDGQGSGTSIFDPVLTELMYSWFCPKGGQIIDPFAGGSVRGIVAAIMDYHYWGCDLSGRQIDANKEQALKICPDAIIHWRKGDALKKLHKAPNADFIFTCPPYGDLEVYSTDPADLSTMDFPQFIESYRQIIKLSCDKLRDNRFACIVVGDYRDKQGNYKCFPQHTIQAFLDAGLNLYNEIILVTSVGSLPIRVTKQFEASRKVGKTHQNVLIFVKGDPREAVQTINKEKEKEKQK